MWPTQWYVFALEIVHFIYEVSVSQVDKLFNPFTLLAGPALVCYVIYKSTIPVDQGGYHLPWW